MCEYKIVSFDEIKKTMKEADKLFDIVRLVNPINTEVIEISDDNVVVSERKPCFDTWEKNQRCNNCISLKACSEKFKMTKFEFRNNDIYSVLSVPFVIGDEKSNKVYALELVNKVTNNMFMHTYGRGKITDEVAELNHKIYEDSLTGAFNRRYFDEGIYLFDMMDRSPQKIGFLLADVKKFKSINDVYGHIVGDNVLKTIAETLKNDLKDSDCIIRMGGDEFLVIIRNCEENVVSQKEKEFKKIIKECKVPESDVKVEINIGTAYNSHFKASLEEIKRMYELADKNMYIDKKNN